MEDCLLVVVKYSLKERKRREHKNKRSWRGESSKKDSFMAFYNSKGHLNLKSSSVCLLWHLNGFLSSWM
jgi:hypothetical protein